MHMHMRMVNMHISIIIVVVVNFLTMLSSCSCIYERIIIPDAYIVNR